MLTEDGEQWLANLPDPLSDDTPDPGRCFTASADGVITDNTPEPTTWEPIDLGPWLRGEIQQPTPTLGIRRSDGLLLIYPGREHAVVGETESGKSWLALGCVAAELLAHNHVVYVHYEETDPAGTIERLRLLGVNNKIMDTYLHFFGPTKAPHTDWVTRITQLTPTLVVHDGVNEAMTLIGAEIKDVDGVALFRRRLVTPFLGVGAAVLACDHMPLAHDSSRRDAYGSVHKGNALNGARMLLENVQPFGRNMRGVSRVYVTKDRPGYLRTHGRPSKTPGKTYVGTLVVDASDTFTPDYMMFYAPHDDDQPTDHNPAAALADTIHQVITAQPDATVPSMRMLFAQMREAGHEVRDDAVRDAVDDLLVARRLVETPGKRGARAYRAVPTASHNNPT